MGLGTGKSSGSTYNVTTPQLTPEQTARIRAENEFFTGTIVPSYQQAVGGAKDVYNLSAGGVTNAGQNLASMGTQVQEVAGSTGESALRTGITGLENLFGKDYEQQQLQAALAPAQMQYYQNLANQQAGFGGAGQLGSARAALAQTQLAGQTQAAQQAAAANILGQIAQQRAGVGSTLAQLGQSGLQQALTGAKVQTDASMIPQELFNKYASVIFGTPSASYAIGPYGQSTSSTQSGAQSNFGIKI